MNDSSKWLSIFSIAWLHIELNFLIFDKSIIIIA